VVFELSRIKVGEGIAVGLNTSPREKQPVGNPLRQGLVLEVLRIVRYFFFASLFLASWSVKVSKSDDVQAARGQLNAGD
jgi:hypothetical protein